MQKNTRDCGCFNLEAWAGISPRFARTGTFGFP